MGGTPQPALGRARSEKVKPQERRRTSSKVAGPGLGGVCVESFEELWTQWFRFGQSVTLRRGESCLDGWS